MNHGCLRLYGARYARSLHRHPKQLDSGFSFPFLSCRIFSVRSSRHSLPRRGSLEWSTNFSLLVFDLASTSILLLQKDPVPASSLSDVLSVGQKLLSWLPPLSTKFGNTDKKSSSRQASTTRNLQPQLRWLNRTYIYKQSKFNRFSLD